MPARKYSTKQKRRDAANAQLRAKRQETRDEILCLLGGCCSKCGFSDQRALQVDHVNGDGYKMNKKGSYSRLIPVLEAIKKGSSNFQLLCANCNQIKKYEEQEDIFGDLRMAAKAAGFKVNVAEQEAA